MRLRLRGSNLLQALVSVAGEIPLPQFTQPLGADGMPQKGIQDDRLDGCRALERGDCISVADDQLAQRITLQMSWILRKCRSVNLDFSLPGPGLGVLAG